jgi:hypothetical protein
MHIEELHSLYASLNIINVIHSRRMRRAEHEREKIHENVDKPGGRRPT